MPSRSGRPGSGAGRRAPEVVDRLRPLCLGLPEACERAERDELRGRGEPFFVPLWWPDAAGMLLDGDGDGDGDDDDDGDDDGDDDDDDDNDWAEIAELPTDSYCSLAPTKLARLVR